MKTKVYGWYYWVAALALASCLAVGLVPTGLWSQSANPQPIQEKQERHEVNAELEELKRTNPEEYKRGRARLVLMAQMYLGELGYGTLFTGNLDERTQRAIREYQAHNGLKVTGDVDGDTVDHLMADSNVLRKRADLGLPSLMVYTDAWDEGYFAAKGSWFWEGGPEPPISTSRIRCWKDGKRCVEARATEFDLLGHFLAVEFYEYEIERWDRETITTLPEEDPPLLGCQKVHLLIQRQDKRVLQFEIPDFKGSKECETFSGLRRSTEVHAIRLEGGEKIYLPKNESRRAASQRILRIPDDVRKLVETQ